MNNPKEGKAFYIIISLLIAIGFWFYVVNEVDTDAKDTIRNIPVVITGQEELLERDLMLIHQDLEDLDLKIEGNRKSLMKLTRENITITVDVSKLTAAGEYELRCNISLPNTVSASSVTIKNRDNRMKVTVEDRITKTVEVKGTFTGTLASGYQAEEFQFTPANLVIAGPASLIESVDHAAVTLGENNLTESYSGLLPVEFADKTGAKVDAERLECAVSEVYTVYPIAMEKEIPLTVEFVAGGGATEEHIVYKMTPETILVSGSGMEVSQLSEWVVGSIDLAKVGGSSRFVFGISLPEKLICKSGETEAVVTVNVEGLSTKTLEVTRIESGNVPEGYECDVLTEKIMVTLRGEKSAVESVTADQVRAVADLSEFTAAGTYKATVRLTLEGVKDAGVLDEGKSVSVELRKLGE